MSTLMTTLVSRRSNCRVGGSSSASLVIQQRPSRSEALRSWHYRWHYRREETPTSRGLRSQVRPSFAQRYFLMDGGVTASYFFGELGT